MAPDSQSWTPVSFWRGRGKRVSLFSRDWGWIGLNLLGSRMAGTLQVGRVVSLVVA